MPGQDILVDEHTPEFTAYLALPASGSGPGLIVLQEIFGVNPVMRGICDQFVPPAVQSALHKAFDHRDDITVHDYPGKDHAFARTGGRHFDTDAAALANSRSITFLREHLS